MSADISHTSGTEFFYDPTIAGIFKICNNVLSVICCILALFLCRDKSKKRVPSAHSRFVQRLLHYLLCIDLYSAGMGCFNNFYLPFLATADHINLTRCHITAFLQLHSNIMLVCWTCIMSSYIYLWLVKNKDISSLEKSIPYVCGMLFAVALLTPSVAYKKQDFEPSEYACFLSHFDLTIPQWLFYYWGWILISLATSFLMLYQIIGHLSTKAKLLPMHMRGRGGIGQQHSNENTSELMYSLQRQLVIITSINVILWSATIVGHWTQLLFVKFGIGHMIGWMDALLYVIGPKFCLRQRRDRFDESLEEDHSDDLYWSTTKGPGGLSTKQNQTITKQSQNKKFNNNMDHMSGIRVILQSDDKTPDIDSYDNTNTNTSSSGSSNIKNASSQSGLNTSSLTSANLSALEHLSLSSSSEERSRSQTMSSSIPRRLSSSDNPQQSS